MKNKLRMLLRFEQNERSDGKDDRAIPDTNTPGGGADQT